MVWIYCFGRIPGRRRAGWTRGQPGRGVGQLQWGSWVGGPLRPPWKTTQGLGLSQCQEHPYGCRFNWLDQNVPDIPLCKCTLTQRWGQQQMEFWGRPSQNHLSLHLSQKGCCHSASSPLDKKVSNNFNSGSRTRVSHTSPGFTAAVLVSSFSVMLSFFVSLAAGFSFSPTCSLELRICGTRPQPFLIWPELYFRCHCSSGTECPCPFPCWCCSPVSKSDEMSRVIGSKNYEDGGRLSHLPALDTYCGRWSWPWKELQQWLLRSKQLLDRYPPKRKRKKPGPAPPQDLAAQLRCPLQKPPLGTSLDWAMQKKMSSSKLKTDNAIKTLQLNSQLDGVNQNVTHIYDPTLQPFDKRTNLLTLPPESARGLWKGLAPSRSRGEVAKIRVASADSSLVTAAPVSESLMHSEARFDLGRLGPRLSKWSDFTRMGWLEALPWLIVMLVR